MRNSLLVSSFLILSMGTAFAAPPNTKKAQNPLATPPAPESVKVEVPQSRIAEAISAPEREDEGKVAWEFMASSYMPNQVKAAFVDVDTIPFQGSGIPYLSVTRLSKLTAFGQGVVDLKVGIGLYRMKRDIPLDTLGVTKAATQYTYIVPVRIGAEYRPDAIEWKGFKPYGALSLVPTASLTPRSAVEQGRSVVGFPVEVSAGTLKHLGGVIDPELNLGVTYTMGNFAAGSLTGFGAQAGIRVSL